MVKGLSREGADHVLAARCEQAFAGVADLARRAALSRRDLERLAAAGALAGLAGNRYEARWAVLGVESLPPLLADAAFREGGPRLPAPSEAADLVADYASLGLTLGRHPLRLLREPLKRLGMMTAAEVRHSRHGQRVRAAGLVVNRQRPLTASGVTFMTLEDETGYINVVVWQHVAQRQRSIMLGARLLGVVGVIEREDAVVHLVAGRLEDYSRLVGRLDAPSRDFR